MAKPKFRWITKRKRSEPEAEYETPVWLANKSNGEFFHFQTERERKMRNEILRRCDDNARKLGMDRREFVASSMGMLTTLSVFNMAAGCGDKNGFMAPGVVNNFMAGQGGGIAPGMSGAGGAANLAEASSGRGVTGGMNGSPISGAGGQSVPVGGMGGVAGQGGPPQQMPAGMGGMDAGGKSGSGGRMADGGFMVPNEGCMDQALADRLLKQEYFIMDVQTHHAEGPTIFSCINGDCGQKAYMKAVFADSETTVAVLSGLPGSGVSGVTNGDVQGTFGVSNETLYTTRDQVNMAAATKRMIAHCQVTPNATPAANSAMMEKMYREHQTKGWKCYPPAEGGWFLTDPNAMMFIQKAVEIGEPLICAHKGFPFPGWSLQHADPGPDVGKIATMFPNVNFVIYHSACANEAIAAEGMGYWNPGDPVDAQNGGTSRLAKVVHENGLTNKNVYAEMGSVWNLLMNDPMLSQHYVGKMLKYVGTERLVWGTESIWLGAPQPQIAAFKLFKISDEIRDKYGYPDFTDTVKRQVFGLTSAKLYGIDPGACYTSFKTDGIAQYRKEADTELGEGRFAQFRPLMTRYADYILHGKQRRASGAPDA